MLRTTTTAEFFEAKYQVAVDPWDFATSSYELQRYSTIVHSLNSRRFERAFEAGCSIGVLTNQLAAVCGELFALDISSTAVAEARKRCSHHSNIHFLVGSLLTDVPEGSFDLIVLSEIGYYFNQLALKSIGELLAERLLPGGMLVAAHWLGHSQDHVLEGDEVHAVIGALPQLRLTSSKRYTGYRMDHWTKA
jgi:SAM-dependent methyltransferase